MIDRLFDLLDIDWSRAFVRWRCRVVLAAMLLFPTATFGLIVTWEQHRLDPIVKQIQQVTDTPTPTSTAPTTHRHGPHHPA